MAQSPTVMPMILDYRECSKIKSSFCDSLACNLRKLVFESRAMLNAGSPTLERSVAVWSDPSGARGRVRRGHAARQRQLPSQRPRRSSAV